MKQQKFLIISIVVLLLLNLGTLSFLFFNAPRPPLPPPDAEMGNNTGIGSNPPSITLKLKEPLSLDDAQVKQIDSIHFAHLKKMRNTDVDFKNNLGKYFALLAKQSYSKGEKDSLQMELIHIHSLKIEESFSNFENIKRMLTPEQQKIFNEMIPDITGRLMQGRSDPIPPGRQIPPLRN